MKPSIRSLLEQVFVSLVASLFWGSILHLWFLGDFWRKSFSHYSSIQRLSLSVAACSVLIVPLVCGKAVGDFIGTWQLGSKQCPHSIKGGEIKDVCKECVSDREAAARRYEAGRREQQRKKELRKEADLLRDQEIKRVGTVMLQKQEYLLTVSPHDFEDLIAETYRRLGYSVTQTPYSNDQGKDAIAKKDGNTYLIECKRYGKDKTIGRPDLQKLFAAMTEEKAVKGFFVATCQFARTAIDYGKKYNIELIDLDRLSCLINQAFPEARDTSPVKVMCTECGDIVHFMLSAEDPNRLCKNGHSVYNYLDGATSFKSAYGMYCDRCGKQMRLIAGRRGKFWGCKGYPICKRTRPFVGEPKDTTSRVIRCTGCGQKNRFQMAVASQSQQPACARCGSLLVL